MFGHGKLERRLRAERPRADDDFVRKLAGRVDEEATPVRRRPSPRLGLALAVAVGSLVAAGMTGGLSYAADAVGHASSSVSHTLKSAAGSGSATTSSVSVNSSLVSAAGAQYSAAGYYCFKNPGGNQAYTEAYISSQGDYDSKVSQGYVAVRYDDGQNLPDTCNNGHFH